MRAALAELCKRAWGIEWIISEFCEHSGSRYSLDFKYLSNTRERNWINIGMPQSLNKMATNWGYLAYSFCFLTLDVLVHDAYLQCQLLHCIIFWVIYTLWKFICQRKWYSPHSLFPCACLPYLCAHPNHLYNTHTLSNLCSLLLSLLCVIHCHILYIYKTYQVHSVDLKC